MGVLTSLASVALTFGSIPGPLWLSRGVEMSTQAFITIRFSVLCLYRDITAIALILVISVLSVTKSITVLQVTIGRCFLQEDSSAGVSLPFSICSAMVFQFSFSLSGPSSSGYFPGSSPLPHLDRFCSLIVFFSAALTYIFSLGNFTLSRGVNYPVCFQRPYTA